MKRSLCWIRRDLRLSDHAALANATAQSDAVAVVFVFDTTILNKLEDKDDKRLTFIHRSLMEVNEGLKKKGSALIILKGDPKEEIPTLAAQLGVDAVYCNRDYEPSSKDRDATIRKSLEKQGVAFHDSKDHVVFEGDEITTGGGTPYKVFTPHKRAWLERFTPMAASERKPDLSKLIPVKEIKSFLKPRKLPDVGFQATDLWLEAGEAAARARLKKFAAVLPVYKKNRDFPALTDGTSGLSVHLRFGTISIREAVRFARAHESEGARVWLSELIWREFYQMILDRFPHVVKGAFKPAYDNVQWSGGKKQFEAWRDGQTGFPLIDAAMRHFKETGWMHNRLRMIVASFLTKDLLVDWREGERWFARRLLDFDLAANNGGWQWAASTGCDAQPYFRIFNPVTQSLKFDPSGEFIRRHVPELRGLKGKEIHWPHVKGKPAGYPDPIVDHGVQRQRCLKMYQSARRNA